jgi:hypothetical protein
MSPHIVQFTHPGDEHRPDSENPLHKSWNTGNHKRKFLLSHGDYIDSTNERKHGELMFWGEWEPPSDVESIDQKQNHLRPKWLHHPYLPDPLPNEGNSSKISHCGKPPIDPHQPAYQNTDPCVFGNTFKYFVCKQYKPGNQRSTKLSSLDPGSLILFGSTKGRNKKESFFQLDTVFVVSDCIEYDPSDPKTLYERVDRIYRESILKMAFPTPFSLNKNAKLRLYFGASWDNQYQGMYSFTPSQLYQGERTGFARVQLKNLDYITNNLNAAPKTTDVSQASIVTFWKKIRCISRKNSCVEGVQFDYPQARKIKKDSSTSPTGLS